VAQSLGALIDIVAPNLYNVNNSFLGGANLEYPVIRVRVHRGYNVKDVKAALQKMAVRTSSISTYHKSNTTPSIGAFIMRLSRGDFILLDMSLEEREQALNTLNAIAKQIDSTWLKKIIAGLEGGDETEN